MLHVYARRDWLSRLRATDHDLAHHSLRILNARCEVEDEDEFGVT